MRCKLSRKKVSVSYFLLHLRIRTQIINIVMWTMVRLANVTAQGFKQEYAGMVSMVAVLDNVSPIDIGTYKYGYINVDICHR